MSEKRPMKPNEMVVLKSVSFKPTADSIAIVGFFYHSDAEDRTKSQYRYEGRIVKEADLKAEIEEMRKDVNMLEDWKWPSKSMNEWVVSYFDMTNSRGAKWLSDRIKKAKSFEDGMKVLDGWKPSKNDYKDSRKYHRTGYVLDDGTPVDLTEDFFKTAGTCTFSKVLLPKRKPPKIFTSETCDNVPESLQQ